MNTSILLEKVELFSGLDEKEFNKLTNIIKEERFKNGNVLFEENTTGETLYIISRGKLSVTIKGDDDNIIEIAILGRYESIGEFSLVDNYPRSASAKCMEDCVLLSITKSQFYNFLEKHPTIGLKLMKNLVQILCERLRITNMRWRNSIIYFGKD